ncbi:MAG TPA: TraB/GumN family protein [Ferruginibacter sp.]|nr:TraB/GumN family protein [Ferruginibacter sp.]
MKSFCLALLLMCVHSLQAQQPNPLKSNADDNTLLWEVSGNGLTTTSYLFGTFHLLCKDDIRFSNALKRSIGNASVVYMELDMDDPATLLGGLSMMSMKNGKKLKDLLTEEEYKRVERFFKDSLKSSLGFFQGMKPMMLTSLVYPKLMPCETVTSIEDQLVKLAKENKKEVRGLETLAFQSSVFDSIPYKEQADELLKTIDSLEKSKLLFDSMTRAYKNQDMAAIEHILTDDDFGMEGNQDLLLDKRNKNWVDQLRTIMHKEPVFVAVGAGHLPGNNGVIALLRKEGYTVRPVENR